MAERNWTPRPVTLDDLPTLVRMHGTYTPSPWTEAQFRAELEKPHSFLWMLTDDETDSECAGWIVFSVLFEQAHLLEIGVDPQYRRQGLARQLMQLALRAAIRAGAKQMTLEVRKGNLPAIQFYHALGFGIERIQKGYYSNGEDAYWMRVEIGDIQIA